MKYTKIILVFCGILISVAAFCQTKKESNMTTEQKRQLVEKFANLMATKKFEQFGEVIAKDYKQHNPMIKQGLEGIIEGSAWFLKVFPDLNVTLDHLLVDGDFVMGHFTWSGTQKEEFMGIPASNKKATWKSMDIWRIEDGKLAEHWDIVDWTTLLQQIQTK